MFFNPATRLKRIGQKYVGRARKGIAAKLENSAKENFIKSGYHSDLYTKMSTGKLKDAPILTRDYMKEIHSSGGRVMRTNVFGPGGNYVSNAKIPNKQEIASELIKTSDPSYVKVGKHLLNPNKKHTIILSNKIEGGFLSPSSIPETGIGDLAHEVGHFRGSISKNKVRRALSNKVSNDAIPFNMRNNGAITTNNPIKVAYDGTARLIEEKLATRSGLTDLKRYRIHPENIQASKEKLSHGYGSYAEAVKGQVKLSAANLVQIPSRRKPIFTS